jgi:peptide-methionine (S)-S-oxide reductase
MVGAGRYPCTAFLMSTLSDRAVLTILAGLSLGLGACLAGPHDGSGDGVLKTNLMSETIPSHTDTITLGAGCFWCVEAVFLELKGVVSVTSGYMGGHVKNPSYKEVCNGTTGHAEVARIVFDPTVISLDEILEVFWMTHDPTTLNRQGADVGTQYRSAVFHHSEEQRMLAERYKAELDKSGAFQAPIVTEIVPASTFYEAEDYHQNYYALNGEQGYCRMVIRPKLDKFRKVFADRLRTP